MRETELQKKKKRVCNKDSHIPLQREFNLWHRTETRSVTTVSKKNETKNRHKSDTKNSSNICKKERF